MRLCLLCCSLLLTACTGADRPQVVAGPPPVSADLLQPCSGYTGPVPRNEGQFSDALIAEARGRACANEKLTTIAEIIGPQ